MKLRLLVPDVQSQPSGRPERCPSCGSRYLARHGRTTKPLTDTKVATVVVERYRCSACRKTFRHYPAGVTRARQSQRLMALAAVLYGCGLSCSAAAHFLTACEAGIHAATVWRDAQQLAQRLRQRPRPGGTVRVLGADETYVRLRGRTVCVGVVTDATTGETLGVDLLVEQDAAAFLKWLRRYVQPLRVEVVVTDDLSTYKPVLHRLRVRHQVCIAHLRKNVTRRLKRLAGQEAVKQVVRDLVKEFPPWGERALRELAKTLRRHVPWRRFLTDLADRWASLRHFRDDPAIPATNNVSERGIGRSKVRYKTVRGFKSEAGLVNLFALTQWLYTPQPVHDLAALLS